MAVMVVKFPCFVSVFCGVVACSSHYIYCTILTSGYERLI